MENVGECTLVHLSPTGEILGAGGRTQGARPRK